MKKIKRLSETTINQIAAGEVVENPASVIKELIENSVDANAKHISIRIQKGGQERIEVEDDGDGMSPEDAVSSLERHATSKIQEADDLKSLSTMGFRGEALAAIASVSEFEIKTSNGVESTQIRGEGGIIEEVVPTARNRGTTISIASLFFNTPARKKFQKSVASNTLAVTKVIELMAMANPEISFSYTSQGEEIYSLEAETQKSRVEAILGPFPYEEKERKFWGFFSAPDEAKLQRRKQFVFVNKRPVFSPLVSKAVQVAYGMRLEKNTYPAFVLFLDLDPASFDINVHPQKKEVRFLNEKELFSNVEGFTSRIFVPKNQEKRTPIFFDERPSFLFSDLPFVKSHERQAPFPFERKGTPLTVLNQYFLLESEGLILVDLHKARARIFYEEMKQERVQTQSLLIPIEIEETDPETIRNLETLGFECRQISRRTMVIDSVPSTLEREDVPLFFDAWKQGKKLEEISTVFCRNGKASFSLEEAMHIFERVQKCKESEYDPLGKRIWKRVLSESLELLLE